jgi:hypothetical protein
MKKVILSLFVVLVISGCTIFIPTKLPLANLSTEELITIISNRDNELWYDALKEIEHRPSDARITAPDLAQAISPYYRDYYEPAIVLISFGEKADTAIPYLLKGLQINDDPLSSRAFILFALGSIGKNATCAIPMIAPYMWNSDPLIRAASGGALELITGIQLIDPIYMLDVTNPRGIVMDDPEGTIVTKARDWWIHEGITMNWSKDMSECEFSITTK